MILINAKADHYLLFGSTDPLDLRWKGSRIEVSLTKQTSICKAYCQQENTNYPKYRPSIYVKITEYLFCGFRPANSGNFAFVLLSNHIDQLPAYTRYLYR